jgi:hypothetical protein
MTDEIEALRAEVAALRSAMARQRAPSEGAMTRRRLLTGLAGLGTAGAAGVAAAEPAGAADGDPVTLGARNTGDLTTVIERSSTGLFPVLFLTGMPGQDPDHNPGPPSVLEIAGPEFGIGVVAGRYGVTAIAGDGSGTGGAALDGWAGHDAAGLHTHAHQGIGVDTGSSEGVPLRLRPGSGPPPTAALVAKPGSMYVDTDCKIWLCTNGSPATWTELLRNDTAAGRVIPITPFRALDTRATGGRPPGSPAVPGQVKGPIKGGQVVTLDLADVDPIPASASGVVGNLIAVTPNYTGFVRAAPSGQPFNATALSFAKGPNIGNAFTVRLGPVGVSFRPSGTASNTLHLVIDITAYIT